MLLEIMLNKLANIKETTTDKFVIEFNLPKEYPAIKARKTEDGGVRDRFFAAKAELPDEATVIHPFNVNGFAKSNENTVYIAPNGDDAACGCKTAPLATLGEAVNRMAGKKGGKIVLMGGNHTLTQTVKLGAEHSGTQESPLIITAQAGADVYVSGGRLLSADAFKPITDEKILARIHPNAKGKVLVCDLKANGIENWGTIGRHGTMLCVNGDRYQYARYPNEGDEVERLPMSKNIINDGKGAEPWELSLSDDRPLAWEWTNDIWAYGSFYYEWTHVYMKLSEINKEKKTFRGDKADREYHHLNEPYGFSHYFVNVLEELDLPGEWCLDRTNGLIYVYPMNGTFAETDDIRLVVSGRENAINLIVADGAENIIIDGLDMGRTGGSPVLVRNSTQVLVQRCRFTSYGHEVDVGGGSHSGVIACRMEYFAETAVNVGGGDRNMLTPANNFIQNCVVFNSKVPFGVTTSGGVGNVVSHNYLYNTRFGDAGNNECLLEYNIVEGGDTETSDSGMVYVGGGGCSSCANHFRYNYFFDFAKLDYGIYFDDMSRGMYAYGNIVVGNGVNPGREDINGKWWSSGGRGYNHHNGGEHVFFNNISIDAGYFAFGGDGSYYQGDFNTWKPWCEAMYGTSLGKRNKEYQDRNPTYRDFCEALDQWHEDIQNPDYVPGSGWAEMRLRKPWHNHYENNLILRADRPYKLDSGEPTATGLETNYITNDDPGFVNEAARDYRFKADAEIFKHIPDFVPPPFERMGIVE